MMRLPLYARIVPMALSGTRKSRLQQTHLRQCKYHHCRGAFPTCAARLRPPLSPRPSGRNSGTRDGLASGALAEGDATRSQRHAAQPSDAVGAFATARAATGIPPLDIWYTTDQHSRQRSIRARSSGASGSAEGAKPDARFMPIALGGLGRGALALRECPLETYRGRRGRARSALRPATSSRRRRPARAGPWQLDVRRSAPAVTARDGEDR
jgi:hypothetical protein